MRVSSVLLMFVVATNDWTAVGKGKMPGYKDKLTDAEIRALVAHMRAFAAK